MDFKSYPSYKDSGVEWLGEVPEHWQIASIKYLCQIDTGNRDTVDAIDNGKYPFFVRSQKIESINEYSFDGEAVLTAGDGAGVGKIYHYINGKFNYHQRVYKMSNFNKVTGKFFFLYFSSLFARVALDGGAKSTVDSLRKAHFDKFIMTIPTLEEQDKIVSFLESETSRIDNLIAKQEKLIKLLEKHRKSIISHAVTKGLDPNVPMKDSGVEWLGEVPKHWEIKHLKHTLEVQLRNGLFKSKEFFGSGNKLINVSDVYTEGNIIDESKLELVMTTQKELDTYKVSHGDIFFVRSSLKFSGIAQSSCYLGNSDDVVFECHIVGARPNTKIVTPEFLIRYLNSVKVINEFIRRSKTTTMTTIDQNQIATVHIALPSIEEQKAINTYLDNKCFKINQLICKQRELITKLKKYRISIISHAVTGKIDVRDLVT